MKSSETLSLIKESVKTRFDRSKRVLSFDEFLDFALQNPLTHTRNAPPYILDAINYFGFRNLSIRGSSYRQYKIFENSESETPQIILGQHAAQNALIQIITSFVRSGRSDKLVVFHGPNGSAKSSMIRALFQGLEQYSNTEEGALFQFSWIFPVESIEKASLGIGVKRDALENIDSFARLDQDKIGAIVRSELHENPLYLIPSEDRKKLFETWVQNAKTPEERDRLTTLRESFLKAGPSHKNQLIFEALLDDYQGDFRKVMRHVRVERFYLSQKFRRGLVSVEPQSGIDASLRQVTLDKSMANLPPALQSLNLFQIEGDLIDGNRGIVEYSDFLKRPVEYFKYLLSTSETNSINMASIMVFLDSLFLATTNDRQLDAFREHPEYNSFKARLELIKVPYLLRYSEEEKIYTETARTAAGPKELVPHTTEVLALWAVLSRLKKPILKNKSPALVKILENLSPLAKAKLYENGEVPENLSDEERRDLKGHIEELVNEHQNYPYYEGLLGASPRELKVILKMAAQNDQYPTLGPNAVFSELRKLVTKPLDYEYLRQEAVNGYHDFSAMIESVFEEWLNWVDREMKSAVGLQDEAKIHEFLANYVKNITSFVRGERIKNRITGQSEPADENLMQEFERLVGVTGPKSDEFRRNVVSRLGAWSIENPEKTKGRELPYHEIFTDLTQKLYDTFHNQQVAKIRAMGAFLRDTNAFDSALDAKASDREKLSEAAALALQAYQGLQNRFHYGPKGAKEVLTELIRVRYV